ncbi:cytosolic sulfotransferase 5-like [Apium graveolens]|uniref:cytosolic sulfotransferase 5-like n=1 Tax=Apium graveolens TaxID=4045 RepID=UPI003D7917B1
MDHLDDEFLSSLPKQKWCRDDLVYQFDGFWFRLPYLKGTLKFLNNFHPLPTDVMLASFPKTGTTWLKSLLFSITNRSSKHLLKSTNPHDLVPTLELQVYSSNLAPGEALTTCNGNARIFSTHVPYQLLSKSDIHSSECRIVYVTRNPKDTLISLWHFVEKSQMSLIKPWTIEEAVDRFCDGVVPYGPYYDHVLRFQKESLERPQKVFFVSYEELKNDTKNQVKKLAEFLGCPFNKEEEAEEIVKLCDIQTLKKHEVNKSSDLPNWFELPYNSFFRQGDVGDYKNSLNSQMIQRIDDMTKDKFHGAGFMFGI